MSLSNELISQFVKVTQAEKKPQTKIIVQGTVQKPVENETETPSESENLTEGETEVQVLAEGDGETGSDTGSVSNTDTEVKVDTRVYVKLDGSELLTPVTTTVTVNEGDRVNVTIENHKATITGNITDPSASSIAVGKFQELVIGRLEANEGYIRDLEADNATVNGRLEANEANIKDLTAENVTITGRLEANEAYIKDLTAENVTITGRLEANEGYIKDLTADKLDAGIANITYAKIETLEAETARIDDLYAKKLDADSAEINYANIDFANIGEAAIKKLFSDSGIIGDLIMSDGKVTGKLVGVTIVGDLIEGNTVVADKLVIKGDDGLFYKLNTDGMTVGAEQTEYNSLHGSIITAKSIVAEQIAVDDLVAFGATIGGFHITSDALYSGVKTGPTNTTRGIYMDNTGQWSIGDANNFLRYYKDQNGRYKLEIAADSVYMGSSGSTITEELDDIKTEIATVKDEVTTLLRIESSRGTVFKNDQVATVLSAVIYRGNTIIRDIDTLRSIMGSSAYLEWSWQHLNDESYGVISADDYRIGNGGFTFTLSPDDVNTKVTFMCTLNT